MLPNDDRELREFRDRNSDEGRRFLIAHRSFHLEQKAEARSESLSEGSGRSGTQ
jgi:hypothetical protein